MRFNQIVWATLPLFMNMTVSQAVVVDYQEGWNLVATGSSAEYSELVFHQNRSDYVLGVAADGGWTRYATGGLQTLETNQGGWVRFNQEVSGFSVIPVAEEVDYSGLEEGWNLIGPGQSVTMDQLRSVIEADFSRLEVERIYAYTTESGWRGYDFGREVGRLQQFEPSDGIWVKLKTPDETVFEGEDRPFWISVRGFSEEAEVRFEVVSHPEKGALMLVQDLGVARNGAMAGVVSYDPHENRGGEDTFQYRASIGEEGTEGYQVSDTVTVRIQINAAMVADAGEAKTASGWQQVVLNGSDSEHNSGAISGHSWTQIAGESVEIIDSDQLIANFIAPNQLGTLEFQLVVSDDEGRESLDTVEISVTEFGVNPQLQRSSVVVVQPVSENADGSVQGFVEWQSTLQPGSLQRDEGLVLQNGLQATTLLEWLTPLNSSVSSAEVSRFGFGVNGLAYLGNGWSDDWVDGVVAGGAINNGESGAGQLWVGHDDLSTQVGMPEIDSLPTALHQGYAEWVHDLGVIAFDPMDVQLWNSENLASYQLALKRESGGTLLDLGRGSDQLWSVNSQGNQRLDGTSDYRLSLYGDGPSTETVDTDDAGQELAPGIVAGFDQLQQATVTPWGSLLVTGADQTSASPLSGYLMELMPGESAADGESLQRVLTSMGKGAWKDVALVLGADYSLISGAQLVLYLVDGSAGGRIYKWISEGNYVSGMTRDTVRNLFRSGTLYVASVEGISGEDGYTLAAGERAGALPVSEDLTGGVWVELGVDWISEQLAPNSPSLSSEGATTIVGQAMTLLWNGIEPLDQDAILLDPDRAADKIGVMELNRPSALAWMPPVMINQGDGSQVEREPGLLVAFQGQGDMPLGLDQNGVLITAGEDERRRTVDLGGALFVLSEQGESASVSQNFTLQYLWGASADQSVTPDQILLDTNGGVWLSEQQEEALYHLAIADQGGISVSEVLKAPLGQQIEGITWNSDQSTLFIGLEAQ